MDIHHIVKDIRRRIASLAELKKKLLGRANEKAHALAQYDLSIAKTIQLLKYCSKDHPVMLDGEEITTPPTATAMEKIARGVCYEEAMARDLAESRYKALITAIQVEMAQLNALQSIHRHQD